MFVVLPFVKDTLLRLSFGYIPNKSLAQIELEMRYTGAIPKRPAGARV